MYNLDQNTVVEIEWEQTVVLTPEQVARLMVTKEKANRIRRAKLQQRVFREGLAREQETASNLAELKSWIWSSLNKHMRSSKEVTLVTFRTSKCRPS